VAGALLATGLVLRRRAQGGASGSGAANGLRRQQRTAPLQHSQPRALARKELASRGFAVDNPLQQRRERR
jgi:hypothetical protein